MKKSATIALVALIVATMIIPQSLAETNQGLFYRMEDGDRLYFTMDVQAEGTPWPTEIIYVEIDNASKPIPDPLTDLGDLEHVDKSFYFENGTGMGLYGLIFIFLAQFEFPVGNWSLITTLAGTYLEGLFLTDVRDLSITSGDDYWGYSYKTNDSADTEDTVWADFSKFDGFLQYYRVEHFNTTTQSMLAQYEVNRFSYHNLRWGFNDGARFDFHLVMDGESLGYSTVDEQMYVKIDDDGLQVIPYNMTEWDDIPFFGADLYWANDSIFFDPIFSYSWRLAVPVGNWSLLDDFIEDRSSVVNVTLEDLGPWFWGYSWNDTSGDVLFEVYTDYLKVDGFIARHTVLFTNTTTSEYIGNITISRTGIEQYTDDTAPSINHPDDIEFMEGSTGFEIIWTPTDDYPATFEISVNEVVTDIGSWTSVTSIVLDLDQFTAGVYTCTITVYDFAGNHVTDSVLVNVTAAPPTGNGLPDWIMDNLLYIGIGVGAVVLIGVVVIFRKRS
ncbi:MAG: hypothetical protein ACW96M_02055 [Candidatus Thorarchaeota archaeon]